MSAETWGASQAPSDSAAQAKASGKKKKRGSVVYRAVAASQDRKGLFYYAIKQALTFQGYDVDQHGFLIKLGVKGNCTGRTSKKKALARRRCLRSSKRSFKSHQTVHYRADFIFK
uniref:Uncharacterized protein n=1 Tax=Pundamilia nyererei TaxID=303518 RepID=A0A3B4H3R8_9CICH